MCKYAGCLIGNCTDLENDVILDLESMQIS